MKRFGVMLDCSRNAVMKPSEIKKFARILKDMGYNMLQLYTEDTYEVDNEPYFGYMRGRYSQAELTDIVNYCNGIGVEVIPCIQTLAHLSQIFRWKIYRDINDCNDILLAGEEKTYQLIDRMFYSLRKCFTSKYIHIGMDEAHMLGFGKYKDKNGIRNPFDILKEHLEKVLEIAKKYEFKPIMWSDMFFRLANQGEYYPENPTFSEEVKGCVPKEVGLVYWDYYHTEKEYYTKMFKAHAQATDDMWFAGGAWSWTGFASGNKMTLDCMLPAVEAAKESDVENIFFTMWGDDGKECSFYSLLPSLFTLRRYYDGERDLEKIKQQFFTVVGENYDAMFDLDSPNNILGNDICVKNVCKHMLYSDPFIGVLDSTVCEGAEQEFAEKSIRFKGYAKHSNFSYLYLSAAALCDVLKIKYSLGVRTRDAYHKNDKDALLSIANDYKKTWQAVERFHKAFSILWARENKPFGFEVQDQRLGGLIQRLKSCRKRLMDYATGKISEIPELNEKLLDFYCNGEKFEKTIPDYNSWEKSATVNIMAQF